MAGWRALGGGRWQGPALVPPASPPGGGVATVSCSAGTGKGHAGTAPGASPAALPGPGENHPPTGPGAGLGVPGEWLDPLGAPVAPQDCNMVSRGLAGEERGPGGLLITNAGAAGIWGCCRSGEPGGTVMGREGD